MQNLRILLVQKLRIVTIFLHVYMLVCTLSVHARVYICMWSLMFDGKYLLHSLFYLLEQDPSCTSPVWLTTQPVFPRILCLPLLSTEIAGRLRRPSGFCLVQGIQTVPFKPARQALYSMSFLSRPVRTTLADYVLYGAFFLGPSCYFGFCPW